MLEQSGMIDESPATHPQRLDSERYFLSNIFYLERRGRRSNYVEHRGKNLIKISTMSEGL